LKNETNKNTRTVNADSAASQSKNSIDNSEEDIDFLLSLKEPVQNNPTTVIQSISISHNIGKRLRRILFLIILLFCNFYLRNYKDK
jgi:hypothetical protein